jgi:LysM domain
MTRLCCWYGYREVSYLLSIGLTMYRARLLKEDPASMMTTSSEPKSPASPSPLGSEKDLKPEVSREPLNPSSPESLGVYLRNDLPATAQPSAQKELDVLWAPQATTSISGTIREDHHPLLSFGGGLITGILATSLLAWVFMARPQTPVIDAVTQKDTKPVIEQGIRDNEPAGAVSTPEAGEANGGRPPVPTESSVSGETLDPVKGTMYTVKPGDTMGGIANKFYGSSAPEYVLRITKANNMSSSHRLSLNQELVIPPKNYTNTTATND